MGKEQDNALDQVMMNPELSEDLQDTIDLNTGSPEEDKLAAAQAELAEYRDKMLRAAAEFDNYKKRMERDRNAAMKYAGEHILREMLPVVDNLERAIAQGVMAENAAEQKLAALLEGVQLTLKSMLAVLEKFEVKAIESVGRPFDPNLQEALVMEPSDVVPVSHVVSEFEKGYYYKDRLLRVAKVIVSSGKAAA